MPLPIAARDYLVKGLQGTPIVLSSLVGRIADDNPIWDKRPDPERFTLREAVAHLADWEPIWVERISRMQENDHPFLPSVDEGALAIENGYSESIPSQSLKRFTAGRAEVVSALASVPDDAWDRTGDREFVGSAACLLRARPRRLSSEASRRMDWLVAPLGAIQ